MIKRSWLPLRQVGAGFSGIAAGLFKFFNGEDLLTYRCNGGGVIALRAVWASAWLFLASLAIYSFMHEKAELEFSSDALKYFARENFQWFGAIFVAVYVALYARFSAQWSYLACLFNQITQSRAESLGTIDGSGAAVSDWAKGLQLTRRDEHYVIWMAGFIADAFELHLAKKGIFAECVNSMLQIPGVKLAFLDASPDHKATLIDFRCWQRRSRKLRR